MSEMPKDVEQVTDTDLQTFAQRLEQWAATLPNRERALLRALVTRAQGVAPADVAGFVLSNINQTLSRNAIQSTLSPSVTRGIAVSRVSKGLGLPNMEWTNLHWMK